MISPRDKDGRINNTPATSVFSDVFAERGLPVRKFTLDDLPGPTDTTSAPVKKVLAIPPPRLRNADTVVETETILGVVSAQLSVVTAPSEDHLFGASSNNNNNTNKVVEDASSIIDIHLLTLATAPEERGQGLGAKLLSALHGECMAKARLMAMKVRSRKALPAGASKAVPTVPALSPRYIDEADPGIAAAAATSAATVGIGTQSPFLQALAGPAGPTLVSLRDARPTTGHFLARTYLEVHPSNVHALSLYRAHGFAAPLDDAKAIKRGFYRGDVRIATSERTKRGGTDAWILQRFDGLLEA